MKRQNQNGRKMTLSTRSKTSSVKVNTKAGSLIPSALDIANIFKCRPIALFQKKNFCKWETKLLLFILSARTKER